MALKTSVKVGSISNLSDARYCSGMSVDMLGFCVVEGQDHYVSPESFNEIRGWFSGPSIVAEAYGVQSADEVDRIINYYHPDYIEVSLQELLKMESSTANYILYTSYEEVITQSGALASFKNQIRKIIIPATTRSSEITELALQYSVLIQVDSPTSLNTILNDPNINGIALKGSPEDKPGLKNYDHLSDILDLLEVID